MPTTATREVSGDAGLGLMVRAALPSLPVLGSLPGVRKSSTDDFTGLAVSRPPVTVEREHVEAYAAVCGFPSKDTVPLTYPHLLAFGLHMAMMTDRAFPAPAIGTVHLENSVTGHRPIAVGETLDVSAAVGPAADPRQGHDLRVHQHRPRRRRARLGEHLDVPAPRQARLRADLVRQPVPRRAPRAASVWKLPADLGRRYAAVSGDHNPIHLYPLTAKALGFPRQIAHGMWTLARCVAALENRLPDAVRVEAAFKKPVLLPGSVAFGSAPIGDGYAFSLTRPKDGAPARGRAHPGRLKPQVSSRRGRTSACGPCPASRSVSRTAFWENTPGRGVPDAEVGDPVAVPVAGHRQVAGGAEDAPRRSTPSRPRPRGAG